MAQNLGNNVEPQGRGSINGGINAAAQANNVHQDWELSSSDGESEEEPMFECKRCPGTRFTAEEKERHREMHQQPHRNMVQNQGNNVVNVAQQIGGGNNGGGNAAAPANNVRQDWELSSSDSETEAPMFECRLCPGTRFTAEAKESHREMHAMRRRQRGLFRNMAQNLGNNVEQQVGGGNIGGGNPAAQANNVHQDWELSSSDGEAEEELMFSCRLCPGTRFTAEEKERHREMHQQRQRNRNQQNPGPANN